VTPEPRCACLPACLPACLSIDKLTCFRWVAGGRLRHCGRQHTVSSVYSLHVSTRKVRLELTRPIWTRLWRLLLEG
jgi:hypothetical protein